MPALFSPPFRPEPLHIPDGFLSPPVAALCWLLAVIGVALALRRIREEYDDRLVPFMGVMAAFIFAAQMINFPVAGGTSGHLLGGALAAITLGPWAGILVMTVVVGIQALLFQDGGLLVMGANIFNMGILTALIGYGLYRGTSGRSRGARLAVAGLAAWLSVMAAALATALQLWLSGTSALRLVMPAMLGVHALIGVGEALITTAALAFILRTRPGLLETSRPAGKDTGWITAGVLIALATLLLSPLASLNPDGLERVAANLGFSQLGQTASLQLLSGYSLPVLGNSGLSTILAGLLGLLTILGAIALGARLLRPKQSSNPGSD